MGTDSRGDSIMNNRDQGTLSENTGTPGMMGPEDRRKHLEFVQGVIARLAQSSATAKGWSLTIVGADFGFAAFRQQWYLLSVGVVIIVWFSFLDMYYLHQERLFRDLYNAVRLNQVDAFNMDISSYREPKKWFDAYMSISVFWFYIPLILAGCIVMGVTLAST